MFIRKNGILYNLNIYAKVFPDKERLALCLADVQGDFDTIDFKSQEELNTAFTLIIKFFKQSNIKKNKEADNILDLDNNTEQSEYIRRAEQRIQDIQPNPWSDPLAVNLDTLPVGVSREEWEQVRRNNQTNDVHTFNNTQIDSRVTFSEPMRDAILDTLSESNGMINNRLNVLEEEHNNMLEELRARNNMLEHQVESLRSIVNTLVEQRDDTGYELSGNTWDL